MGDTPFIFSKPFTLIQLSSKTEHPQCKTLSWTVPVFKEVVFHPLPVTVSNFVCHQTVRFPSTQIESTSFVLSEGLPSPWPPVPTYLHPYCTYNSNSFPALVFVFSVFTVLLTTQRVHEPPVGHGSLWPPPFLWSFHSTPVDIPVLSLTLSQLLHSNSACSVTRVHTHNMWGVISSKRNSRLPVELKYDRWVDVRSGRSSNAIHR